MTSGWRELLGSHDAANVHQTTGELLGVQKLHEWWLSTALHCGKVAQLHAWPALFKQCNAVSVYTQSMSYVDQSVSVGSIFILN